MYWQREAKPLPTEADEWSDVAILRRCDRCHDIIQFHKGFKPHSHFCVTCGLSINYSAPIHPMGLYGLARTIRITAEGKRILREIHEEDAARDRAARRI